MLEVIGLSVAYGKHAALENANLSVGEGKMVAILGANGAGKSSLLNAIAGRVKPASGRVVFAGQDLANVPQHELVERGLALVPEGRGIFPRLSVEENLALGALPARARVGAKAQRDKVHALFPRLTERSRQIAGTMSGGEQQMVAIARALMSNPAVLLLDEPSLGLAPIVAQDVFRALEGIRAGGLTIMLVEQNARATLAIADRAYLIEAGRIAGSGRAADLRDDPAVINAFLGGASARETNT
ncbi:ABC transporter ATP-binding protein [Roseibium salinum]|uniref:ABC transporter ATP-binding protein n=1 Tax=Roseibium salinum TaxID=1604349 RepID=A0ABT3R7D5_9HYPH|nr:ABC transporter ATP-binding protein [Roseibium sp. DSM 29163]MCX2725072.1 ABC transporter ATP-binding protein [Roseibium sp. DSM 29163]